MFGEVILAGAAGRGGGMTVSGRAAAGQAGSSDAGTSGVASPASNCRGRFATLSTLGISASGDLTHGLDAEVTLIVDDRMELQGSDSTSLLFHWTGPSLEPAFAVGDKVRVQRLSEGSGMNHSEWSVVRSSTATAATLDMLIWGSAVTAGAGAVRSTLRVPGLPALNYVSTDCCSGSTKTTASCEYSLAATFGDSFAVIELGDTGSVGPWTILNGYSEYIQQSEQTWRVRAALTWASDRSAVTLYPRASDSGVRAGPGVVADSVQRPNSSSSTPMPSCTE